MTRVRQASDISQSPPPLAHPGPSRESQRRVSSMSLGSPRLWWGQRSSSSLTSDHSLPSSKSIVSIPKLHGVSDGSSDAVDGSRHSGGAPPFLKFITFRRRSGSSSVSSSTGRTACSSSIGELEGATSDFSSKTSSSRKKRTGSIGGISCDEASNAPRLRRASSFRLSSAGSVSDSIGDNIKKIKDTFNKAMEYEFSLFSAEVLSVNPDGEEEWVTPLESSRHDWEHKCMSECPEVRRKKKAIREFLRTEARAAEEQLDFLPHHCPPISIVEEDGDVDYLTSIEGAFTVQSPGLEAGTKMCDLRMTCSSW